MHRLGSLLLLSVLIVAPLIASRPLAAAEAPRPVVVELFTSQGCSSCPPADALMGELSKRSDVLPLAFHVDYWDRLGWKDPYSSADATDRQRAYAAQFGSLNIYTPQVVIEGQSDVIGSRRAEVLGGIDRARDRAPVVPLALAMSADGLRVDIGARAAARAATLWLVGFDRFHETKVGAGENGGRMLPEYNIVRGLEALGSWSGDAAAFDLPAGRLARYENVALLLQERGGRMLGAAVISASLSTASDHEKTPKPGGER